MMKECNGFKNECNDLMNECNVWLWWMNEMVCWWMKLLFVDVWNEMVCLEYVFKL